MMVFSKKLCTFARLSSSRRPSPAWRASGGNSARTDAEDCNRKPLASGSRSSM